MGIDQGLVWVKGNGEKGEVDGQERSEAVKKRAMAWWNETIVGTAASYALIVSHAAWIRLLLQGLVDDEAIRPALGVQVERSPNTGVSIVEIPRERGCGNLLQFGNVGHLREAAVEGNADERGIE
jgi:broad specificity phosphatase PhoE